MQVQLIDGRSVQLPDFLIVGAAKAGTTSLYNYLTEHPQVFSPIKKELYFFTCATRPDVVPPGAIPISTFEKYISAFRLSRPDEITGEATPDYLPWHAVTIPNIKKYHPRWKELKVIILLRDPAERAFSSYNMFIRFGRINGSFGKFYKENEFKLMADHHDLENLPFDYIPDYIRSYGLYHESVAAYLSTFPQTKIYLYEDLNQNSSALYQDVCNFLNIDSTFTPKLREKHNPGGLYRSRQLEMFLDDTRHPLYRFIAGAVSFFPKLFLSEEQIIKFRFWLVDKLLRSLNRTHPKLSKHVRRKLVLFYKEDIEKLQLLIKRDLSAWLKY